MKINKRILIQTLFGFLLFACNNKEKDRIYMYLTNVDISYLQSNSSYFPSPDQIKNWTTKFKINDYRDLEDLKSVKVGETVVIVIKGNLCDNCKFVPEILQMDSNLVLNGCPEMIGGEPTGINPKYFIVSLYGKIPKNLKFKLQPCPELN